MAKHKEEEEQRRIDEGGAPLPEGENNNVIDKESHERPVQISTSDGDVERGHTPSPTKTQGSEVR